MPITQILLTATSAGSSPPPATVTAIMSLIASDYSGSGTTWTDSSGSSHPGTLVNTPAYQGATIPKYFTFDKASTEFVQGPDLGNLSTWTIEAWFRLTEPLGNTTATALITTTYEDGNGINYGNINYTFSNYIENGGSYNDQLTVGFFDGNWHTTAGFVPTVGRWYHVVGTYDGNIIRQWVDGSIDTTRTITATPIANGGPVRIARRWDGYPSTPNLGNYDASLNFFSGDISVVKIYNGVLTDEQIVNAYETTKGAYPNYTLTAAANNVNEGSSLTFTVGGNRITNGTYYWTVETNSVDFGTASGSFTITNSSGTFSVTPTADATTEGSETFTVSVRSSSISGTVLATSASVTINDTSLDPAPPFSLSFSPSSTSYMVVQNTQSDWDLGTTWTIEYWSKAAAASTEGTLYSVMGQAVNSPIDILYHGGELSLNGNRLVDEPSIGGIPSAISDWSGQGGWNQGYYSAIATTGGTGTGLTVNVAAGGGGYINISAITIANPGSGYTSGDIITINNENDLPGQFMISGCSPIGKWTHVALVGDGTNLNIYYDGTSVYSGGAVNLNNSSNDLIIGKRGPENFQYFNGKLAMIRISSTAKYTSTFTPTTTYGVGGDTRLMLGSDTPLVDSTGNHPIDNQGAVVSQAFPPVLTTLEARNYGQTFGYSSNQGSNQISVLISDYPDIVNVPNGATVTVSGLNTGTYTVSGVMNVVNGTVRLLVSGFGGQVNGNDTLTFTWYTYHAG
jgi:hypothetical protein